MKKVQITVVGMIICGFLLFDTFVFMSGEQVRGAVYYETSGSVWGLKDLKISKIIPFRGSFVVRDFPEQFHKEGLRLECRADVENDSANEWKVWDCKELGL